MKEPEDGQIHAEKRVQVALTIQLQISHHWYPVHQPLKILASERKKSYK